MSVLSLPVHNWYLFYGHRKYDEQRWNLNSGRENRRNAISILTVVRLGLNIKSLPRGKRYIATAKRNMKLVESGRKKRAVGREDVRVSGWA